MGETIYCDGCQSEFEMKVKYEKKRLKGHDVVIGVIKCPECKQLTKSLVSTSKLKRLNRKRKDIIRKIGRVQDEDEVDRLRKEAEELRKQMRREHRQVRQDIAFYINP